MSFAKSLNYGQQGESEIARWFQSRGNMVLPVYETNIDNGKGPQIFARDCEFVAPDMLVFNGKEAVWVEAKRKNAFSWHRKTQKWVTGIDLRHYLDYLEVQKKSPWNVWLLFLHENGKAKDSPPSGETGLFGNKLSKLQKCENHRHDNWGKSGMVYWAIESLIKLAELDEIRSL